MEAREILEAALGAGVLVEAKDGETLEPSRELEAAREAVRATAAGDVGLAETAGAALDVDPAALEEVEEPVLVDALAIDRCDAGVDGEEALRLAYALNRRLHGDVESGRPRGFTPIAGEEIEAFIADHPAAVIYFWRPDCEPCDTVRADLEALDEREFFPPEMGRGAVNGQSCAELIADEYDVGVAPTTLFCRDGRVDARLVGAPLPEVLEGEIDEIRPDDGG